MYLGAACMLLDLTIVVIGWRSIFRRYWSKEEGRGQLVTTGIYAHVRHPQYTGFQLITLGMLIEWATIPLLVMWPVLLALTRDTGKAGRVLAEAGLDHETVRAALATEVEWSLEAVGVFLGAFDLSPAAAPLPGKARLGTSTKLALERALRAAVARGDRRINSAHLLLGLLRGHRGTVPRALAIAEADPIHLAAQAEAALVNN